MVFVFGQNNSIIQGLCGLLNISNKDVNASFNKNQAEIEIKAREGLTISFPSKEKRPVQIISHEYSEKANGESHKFYFEFNPDYELKFYINRGFHSVVRKMFGRKKEELEEILGFFQETVQTSFKYYPMQFGLWHVIPRKVLEYVSNFRFVIGDEFFSPGQVSLQWPYKTGSNYSLKQDPSRIWISHGIHKGDLYQKLIQNLVDSGLIRREVIEDITQRGTEKQEKLLLTQERMDYKKMRDFEELIADLNNGYGKASLSFSGNISTEDFVNIPELFDEYIHEAWLKTNLFGLYQSSSLIQFIHTENLERAARVAELLPVNKISATCKRGGGDIFVLYERAEK